MRLQSHDQKFINAFKADTFYKTLTGLGIRELPLTDELERSFSFPLKNKILVLARLSRVLNECCVLFLPEKARASVTLKKTKKKQ